MRKFKKFLAAAMTGAMMFGSVAMAAPAVSVYAEDAKTRTDLTIEVEYTTCVATVTSTAKDSYIKLEVLKLKNDQPDTSKPAGTYTYPLDADGKAKIDLSFLGLSKTCAIQVRGDADNFAVASAVVTIKGQEKKPKIKYVPAGTSETDATISAEKSFGLGGDLGTVADYQFKTLYGSNWDSLANFDLVTASVAGTTITLRKAAVTETGKEALAGAEVKVKVAAAPKAPKVKVDYKKGTVTFPKGTEVMVLYTAAEVAALEDTPAWMEVTSTKMYRFDRDETPTNVEITNAMLPDYFDVAEDGIVTVKTGIEKLYSDTDCRQEIDWTVEGTISTYVIGHAATTGGDTPSGNGAHTATAAVPVGESAAKTVELKGALGFCGIAADKQDAILANGFIIAVRTAANYGRKKAASSMTFITIDAVETPVPNEADSKVTVDGGTLSWKLSTDEKNYEFTATEKGFEFVISDSAPTADTKWTAVKAGSTVKKKADEVAGKTIYVRKAADAKKEEFPSNAVKVVIKKAEEAAKPVEVIEAKTGLDAWETDVVYYSDVAATTVVDKSTVETPTAGTTYYVKAVYTPTTATTPATGTDYYTTTDQKAFTKATLSGSFEEGKVYYTRAEKTE